MRKFLLAATIALAPVSLVLAAINGTFTPPGGSNKSIQYNQGGTFGGDANITYDTTTRVMTLHSVRVDSITWANGTIQVASPAAGGGTNGGGTGGAGFTFFDNSGNAYGISTMTLRAGASVFYGISGSSINFTVDLSTAWNKIVQLAVDTDTLKSRLDQIGVDTGTLRIATGTLTSRLNQVGIDTGTIRAATGTLTARVDQIGLDTGTIRVATGTLTARVNNLDTSTGALTTRLSNLDSSTGIITTRLSNLDSSTATNNSRIINLTNSTGTWWQDEGSSLFGLPVGTFNCVGAGIVCSYSNGVITLTVSGSGGAGGGGAMSFFLGGTYTGISTFTTTGGDISVSITGSSAAFKVDLSTLNTRANNLDTSTATLTTRANNLDLSTAAAITRLNNLDSSTTTLTSAINSTGTALTNFKSAVAASTATFLQSVGTGTIYNVQNSTLNASAVSATTATFGSVNVSGVGPGYVVSASSSVGICSNIGTSSQTCVVVESTWAYILRADGIRYLITVSSTQAGTGGGTGGGGSMAFFFNGTYTTISTFTTTGGDIAVSITGSSAAFKVDFSTLNTRASNLDSSTATLTTRINSVAQTTGTFVNGIRVSSIIINGAPVTFSGSTATVYMSTTGPIVSFSTNTNTVSLATGSSIIFLANNSQWIIRTDTTSLITTIDLSSNVVYNATGTFSANQTFTNITVGGCTGCGAGGGSASISNPTTGTVVNTGFALVGSSGIAIGTPTADRASLSVTLPNGSSFVLAYFSTGATSLWEATPSSWTVNAASQVVFNTGRFGVGLDPSAPNPLAQFQVGPSSIVPLNAYNVWVTSNGAAPGIGVGNGLQELEFNLAGLNATFGMVKFNTSSNLIFVACSTSAMSLGPRGNVTISTNILSVISGISKLWVEGGAFIISGTSATEQIRMDTSTVYGLVIGTTVAVNRGVAFSTSNYMVMITTWGSTLTQGSPPFVNTGDCGSTPEGTISAGSTNTDFSVNVGGGVVTSCKVTFSSGFPNAPTPTATDNSTTVPVSISAVTAQSVTFATTSSLASGIIYAHMGGH